MSGKRIYQDERAIVVLCSLCVAVSYAFFATKLPVRYNSPDEAANAFFARSVAKGTGLAVPSELNSQIAVPVVHPRSTQVIWGKLAPVSFPGLPLVYGGLASMFGAVVFPYLTPLLAIAGLIGFYWLVRQLSGVRTAALASVLLAVTPAFWYYHVRGFFHNAAFFDLLILGAAFAAYALHKRATWSYIASGMAVGLALSFRTSEALLVAAGGALWFAFYGAGSWKKLWLVALGAFVGLVPLWYGNWQIYGSLLSFGYGFVAEQQETVTGLWQRAAAMVLPFGFHPRVILSVVRNYLLGLTWWWAVVALWGLYQLWQSRHTLSRAEFAFWWAGALCTFWLVILYGSWKFNDNPDPSAVTIGTSYVRYFLPVYAFMLWPAARSFAQAWQRGSYSRIAIGTVVGLYVLLSTSLVVFEHREGLMAVRKNVAKFEHWNRQVVALTEPQSVIVTGFTDKIFWPEREVVYALAHEHDYQAAAQLLDRGIPVYYFHATWKPKDFATVVGRDFTPRRLALTPVQASFEDFSLYRITKLE